VSTFDLALRVLPRQSAPADAAVAAAAAAAETFTLLPSRACFQPDATHATHHKVLAYNSRDACYTCRI